MADLLRKQLVAVVDDRTTMVCLHAAGQVRDVGDPFDTLAGRFMTPPFHRGCRSHVAAYMVGFGRRLRDRANREILRRPPKQKRISPSGYEGRLPGPVAPPDVTGEQITRAIRRGLPAADADLAAVPRAQVYDWIVAHPERFRVTAVGGRVGSLFDVLDRRTGQRLTIRLHTNDSASVAEVAGQRLARAVGLPSVDTVMTDRYVTARSVLDDGWTIRGVGVGGSPAADAVRALVVGYLMDDTSTAGLGLVHLDGEGGTRLHQPSFGMPGVARDDTGAAGAWSPLARARVPVAGYLATLGVSPELVDRARDGTRADVDRAVTAALAVTSAQLLADVNADTADWLTVWRARRALLRSADLATALRLRR